MFSSVVHLRVKHHEGVTAARQTAENEQHLEVIVFQRDSLGFLCFPELSFIFLRLSRPTLRQNSTRFL